MKTVTIASWEFTHDDDRLTYRLTAQALAAGILVLLGVAGACALLFLKEWRAGTGLSQFLWCAGAVIVFVGCGWGLFHHARSRAFPYTLDKRLDRFWNGSRKLCALSEIQSVEIVRTAGVDGADHVKRPHYYVEFSLRDGSSVNAFLSATTSEQAAEYAAQLEEFFGK